LPLVPLVWRCFYDNSLLTRRNVARSTSIVTFSRSIISCIVTDGSQMDSVFSSVLRIVYSHILSTYLKAPGSCLTSLSGYPMYPTLCSLWVKKLAPQNLKHVMEKFMRFMNILCYSVPCQNSLHCIIRMCCTRFLYHVIIKQSVLKSSWNRNIMRASQISHRK